jgi:ech hydrogenase subunit E
VLPEPVHLDLVLEDEKVVQAIPALGFVHRGLEKLVEKKDYPEMVYVAERICGICSFIHAQTYCQTVEAIMGVEVPPRAQYLRTIWAELMRIHSHLLWLGLFADAFGFESLFMHCWRVRERIVDITEETTGQRVIYGTCKIGGVKRDIDNDTLYRIVNELDEIEAMAREVTRVFEKDRSVKRRLVGLGVLTQEQALALGAVGPTLRGSGVSYDARKLGYAAYGQLHWEPAVETAGDCFARTMVRIKELYTSFDMVRQAVKQIPGGEFFLTVKGNPLGEATQRVEQPRGEVIHYVKANGTKNLERFRVRTPTFANIPALVTMLAGVELADVPVIVLTIDPCISCTER